MSKQIFINLPVADPERSMEFYSAIGFNNNPQFSDDSAKCMVWSDHIFLMLLSRERFASFATKPLADAHTQLGALYSLSLDSVEAMHAMMEKGLAAGGKEPAEMRDYSFMVQRTLEDFDGHTWEIFFMDVSKFPVQ